MNKEKFMKQVRKEISGIPKYANSPSQVEAIAIEMWQEANDLAEKEAKAKDELKNMDKDFHKKQKKNGRKNKK